jgi:hypothetical protein
VVTPPKQLNKPTLAKIGQFYNQENIEKLAVEHPVIAELQKEMVTKQPEEEVELPAQGSAASDSPYNQPGASTQMVAEDAKRSWAQELYLYLV